MAQPTVVDLLARSEEYIKRHIPAPMMLDVPVEYRPHTVILCCADGRLNPLELFDLGAADAVVIRNIGCVLSRLIEDFLVIDQLVQINEVLIISHTDCGLTHATDDGVHTSMKSRVRGHDEEFDKIAVGSFRDNVARVKSDVEYFSNHACIRKELVGHVFGAVYDIQTGKLAKVEV
ncbi:carbonic anhydrase [Xylariaceae sp. FL1019]|nr:carbonic anhydrase [Xylariaceae sp. FL1019]